MNVRIGDGADEPRNRMGHEPLVSSRSVAPEAAFAFCRAACVSQTIMQCTGEGVVVDANEVFLSLLGHREDTLIGRSHTMLCERSDERADPCGTFWRRLADGMPQQGVFKMIGRSGSAVWLRGAYMPLLDIEPETIMFLGTDVSDKERLEQHILMKLEEERDLRTALEARRSELVSAMTNLAALVSIIAGIARDTHVLALNARIEAARVGDQGTSFGVIASEVARLSTKTHDVTREAQAMLAVRNGDRQDN